MTESPLLRLTKPIVRPFAEFFQREASSGIVLMVSSLVALLLANSDWGIARYFPDLWENTLSLSVNEFRLEKTLSHWINDGLMALFFLIIGLEIKREVLEGELSSMQQAALPLVCAVGGMVVPALLFAAFNVGTPTVDGWGIPMATDIAFALAVVSLLGDRVPLSLRVFLTALAIVDDLGAVLVIAIFYTQDLQLSYLGMAGGIWLGLLLLNYLRVRSLPIYLVLGVVLWYVTLKSGIHATIAGVLLAIAIPFKIPYRRQELVMLVEERLNAVADTVATPGASAREVSEELEALNAQISSPAQRLEHYLHSPVAFVIVPLFAFCNTSLVIDVSTVSQLTEPLAVGIMTGLLLGKSLGITLAAWLAIRLKVASLPADVSWRQLIGVSLLAGIGFTMSIFITLLAFPNSTDMQSVAKLAILVASLLAGGFGYGLLRTANR
ncbi:Na+/H+ antiporter NhaA [Spirosoma montaniterrae]|uniref:Na(+)/H(+) antiporter NhaA n=1 Tax=Spirosoma montaniterrae TaxID=1178516 RepID=A0A1P9WWP9_9BACT|nr:Na+/H+ antiporter NhaA [Spirosoma montaniterrae]AQG79804.1 sodium:proton antiporter [Spirosoma montaniterrae]